MTTDKADETFRRKVKADAYAYAFGGERMYVGPTVLFTDAWCQHDSHVIMWRSWLWLVRGIHVDRNGRRCDRRGNPL